jgi:hypothetical protein
VSAHMAPSRRLAAQGFLNENGRAFAAASIKGLPKTHPTGFGAGSTLTGAGTDQLPLKFRYTGQHGHEQPAMWRCGVGPAIGQRLEANTPLAKRRNTRRKKLPGSTVEPRCNIADSLEPSSILCWRNSVATRQAADQSRTAGRGRIRGGLGRGDRTADSPR